MIRVKATREGLVGHTTASGYIIDRHVPFVALPSGEALYGIVRIIAVNTGKSVKAVVLDVGPWNIDDEKYVFQGGTNGSQWLGEEVRPLSESGVKTNGKERIAGTTNGAGIDLGEKIWELLGLPLKGGEATVEWEWI